MSIHTKGKVKKHGREMAFSDRTHATGSAVITICDVSTWHAKLSQSLVVFASQFGWKWYRMALDYHHRLYAKKRLYAKNLVVDAGLNLLADGLNGDDIEINRVALGDTSTAAAAGDTALGNETIRKAPSSKTVSGNEIFVSTFFTASEANDTHEEVGHFVGGTNTKDSGTLYSRITSNEAADLPHTKTDTDSLTIDYKSTHNAS